MVNCYTTNRRGVSGVWHSVFRMSRVIAKPQHLTLTVNCICVGASFDWRSYTNLYYSYFYYIPKSSTYMEQTHKHTICYFLNTPTTYYLEILMNNAQFYYKEICRVRLIMFNSLISQNYSLIPHHKYKMR